MRSKAFGNAALYHQENFKHSYGAPSKWLPVYVESVTYVFFVLAVCLIPKFLTDSPDTVMLLQCLNSMPTSYVVDAPTESTAWITAFVLPVHAAGVSSDESQQVISRLSTN